MQARTVSCRYEVNKNNRSQVCLSWSLWVLKVQIRDAGFRRDVRCVGNTHSEQRNLVQIPEQSWTSLVAEMRF